MADGPQFSPRLRVYRRVCASIASTGKGGVGKTSIAAATAVRAVELGHRTLVLSTDLAHSLADSLDLPLGPELTEVAPRCRPRSPTSTTIYRPTGEQSRSG
jgi:Mrp family chromosome partitioning ATPase